jgi:putative phage-type endonuclease
MKTHSLVQGSPEWLAYRAQHFNASDAPAMMGCSPYKTRAALLRELHTGLAADVDVPTQRIFDAGRRFEALARPLGESIVGEDLYPVVGSEGRLSASFDGLTMAEDIAFEHKSANAELRAVMTGEDCGPRLPLHYRVQMEQQLMVSGAERVLFMATLWDGDVCTFSRHCWYYPDEELRAGILRGWDQFAADLATYALPPTVEAAPVGKAPETLPALRIEVTGQVTASNLAEFKQTALAAIRSVNRDLKTDADFADADKAIKWCADVETRLKAAKEHALSQTASIDALFKALDDIAAESKAVRLDLGKLAERRKVERKEEAVTAARRKLDNHIAALNGELAPMRLLPYPVDFAATIKGLRSFASMDDALSNAVASAKIGADAQARGIRQNVATYHHTAKGLDFLFADLGTVVHKAPDDFTALVVNRITAHEVAEAAKEAKRQADEAARIAAAEQRARQQAEQAIIAAAAAREEVETKALAEHQRQQAETAAATNASAPAAVPQTSDQRGPADWLRQQSERRMPAPALPSPTAPADEPATLNLGAICSRLGFTVNAAFLLDTLHIKPAATERGLPRFTESQFGLICRQLVSHCGAMAELYAGETA